jgi:hypothetical protein
MSAACSTSTSHQPDPPTPWRQRHPPDGGLLALQLVRTPPLLGLVDGLRAHPERSSDLRPRRSIGPGRQPQQIKDIRERGLGVSHVLQSVQGLLRSAPNALQVLDHSAQSPAGVGPFFGAHVNRYCRSTPTVKVPGTSIRVVDSICDTTFLNSALTRVGSALGRYSRVRYRSTTKKKRPRAAPTAGVVDDIRGN